jgi:putative heme-binding domain-containing protein
MLDPRIPCRLMAFLFMASAIVLHAGASGEEPDPAQSARDRLVAESLLRLKDVDISGNEKLEGAVLRHAVTIRGQENYFLLAKRFRIAALDDDLFQLATTRPASTEGVRGAQVLAMAGQLPRFFTALSSTDLEVARGAAEVLGQLDDPAIIPALILVVPDKKLGRPLRAAATYSLGRTLAGQRRLLQLVQNNNLPEDIQISAANVLLGSADESIRQQAAEHLSLPATADATPLPPIPVLLGMKGDSALGEVVFNKVGTCIKCHRVRGEGKEMGPDLTEIGSKLAPEAMLVSILDPSAGISHSYETHNIILNSGNIISGIIISKTDESITIKTVDAIEKAIATSDIEEMVKSPISLMPADLQKVMTAEDLVNLLNFLSTLKKP